MAKSFSSIMKKLGTTNILIVAVAIVVILCCYMVKKENFTHWNLYYSHYYNNYFNYYGYYDYYNFYNYYGNNSLPITLHGSFQPNEVLINGVYMINHNGNDIHVFYHLHDDPNDESQYDYIKMVGINYNRSPPERVDGRAYLMRVNKENFNVDNLEYYWNNPTDENIGEGYYNLNNYPPQAPESFHYNNSLPITLDGSYQPNEVLINGVYMINHNWNDIHVFYHLHDDPNNESQYDYIKMVGINYNRSPPERVDGRAYLMRVNKENFNVDNLHNYWNNPTDENIGEGYYNLNNYPPQAPESTNNLSNNPNNGGGTESQPSQSQSQPSQSQPSQSQPSQPSQSQPSQSQPTQPQQDDSQAILDFLMNIDPEEFTNYTPGVEHFNDLVRPENYNLVKLKSSQENELSFIDEKVDESKTIYDDSEGDEFPTRLGHVLNHISTKFLRSAIRAALDGFINNEYIEIQKVKCVNTSLSNDCGVFTDRDVAGSIRMDNNPIDGTKSIKTKLESFFRQALHAGLVKDKILESPEKINILNTTKDFINGILSDLNNKYSDAFTIYFEVDFEPADATDDYTFMLKPNNETLSGLIAGIDDVTTQSSIVVAADADCVVNWGQWSDCQVDSLSTCIPTPNMAGQFGARPGIQQRQSQIITTSRGQGTPCPLPQSEVRNCSVPCEDPLEDSPLVEMIFSDFKNYLRSERKTVRCDVFRSKQEARYLSNTLGKMSVSVDSDNNFVRSYIPNKITQDCNNLNISTLYLRTFADDGNYTDKLVIVNPKMEYCTGNPLVRGNLEGSLCSDTCNFIKSNSEDTGQCLNRCVLENNCSPSCCASACMKQGAVIENFESGSLCSFQPYGRSLDECKENCKNDGCNNVSECNRICGECNSISCRWTLPDFTGISEKPTSPNIIATPGNSSATVIWNRADDRGSRIERYIVVAYETTNPENGVRIELATNPSCTNCIHRIDSLKNNLSYTVGVSAVNSGGVSKMSNTVVVIPSTTSVDMNFVQSIQKDAITTIKSDDMLKKTIDKIILQRGNVDEQLLGDLLAYRNQPEDNTLKDLLTKLAGSTVEITI
jgi:hypothetical protein